MTSSLNPYSQILAVKNKVKKILVVSAFPPEQEYLRQHSTSTNIKYLCVGIGPLQCVETLTIYLCTAELPDIVIFCGTAGAYNSNIVLTSAYRSNCVGFTDGARINKQSYFPPNKQDVDFLKSNLEITNIPATSYLKTICPPSITTAPEISAKFSEHGNLENLEFYAMAMVAAQFKLAWLGYLGVANHVGMSGHSEWMANHLKASENAGKLFLLDVRALTENQEGHLPVDLVKSPC